LFVVCGSGFADGAWGVGESCHNSQWVYGVNNLYAYGEKPVFFQPFTWKKDDFTKTGSGQT
jgi:hypothetical protein